MQRILGIASATAATFALFLLGTSLAGARPFEERAWLFFASVALALGTSAASQRVLSPHFRSQPILRRLTLRPMLPKWAAVAVWLVIAFGVLFVLRLTGVVGGITQSSDNSLSLLASALLFVFFFTDAVVLLLVPAEAPASQGERGAA